MTAIQQWWFGGSRGDGPSAMVFPRDGFAFYSLTDNFSIADPSFNEAALTYAQQGFGDQNPHPVNGASWPIHTLTPAPDAGDVIWVRKTLSCDVVTTWHMNIVCDNTMRLWINGTEVGYTGVGETFRFIKDFTPVLGDNVLVIRVVETLGATPSNRSQAAFEVTRDLP